MKMRNLFIATFASASLFGSVAQAETYICKMKLNGPAKGFISDTITINIVDGALNAVVSDAIILATNGRAVVATHTTITPKRRSVMWDLYSIRGPKNQVYGKVSYKLSIWKSRGNKASVSARYPALGPNSHTPKEVSASGKCKLR